MIYLMPDGTQIKIWKHKSIADFSTGTLVYKLQIDLIASNSEGRIIDSLRRIILPADGTKDFINTYKSVHDGFESITVENMWKMLEQHGAISGGKITDYDGKEIK